MIARRLLAWAAACALAAPAAAQDFSFPGPATRTATTSADLTSTRIPTGPWADGTLPTRLVEGPVTRSGWRIAVPGIGTLDLMAQLRDQLAAMGYRTVFSCETAACGGFDFRYATEVLPEPDMHVDLGDFRFLAAEKPEPDGPAFITLLVSRSAEAGFVQVTQAGSALPETATPDRSLPAAEPPPATGTPDIAAALQAGGSAALDDLAFLSGSARLGSGDFASLTALAAFLRDNPELRITLVGHTDAAGTLAANIALSKARAASVRDRLVTDFGIAPDRIGAEGAGYLAPRASNLTEDGRNRNRRVEAMINLGR